MMLMWNLLIIIITFLPLSIIIYKGLKEIEEYIKNRKKLNESTRTIFEFLVIMYIVPIIIYQMDRFNLFSFFKLTENINTNYDWLSFIGTHISTWVSAFLLIYVTREDRRENNENVRESQRPCLCTKLYLPHNLRITDTSLEGYISQSDEKKNTKEYYTIRISNSGQTVAIIDTEKSYILAEKFENEMVELNESESELRTVLKDKKVYLEKYEDRLHISSNSSVEVVITDDGMYKNIEENEKVSVKEIYVEYTDLFGKRYRDYIKIEDGKTKVIIDNELVV